MRIYETIFIVHPDAVGEQYAGIIEKFKKVLEDQQAIYFEAGGMGNPQACLYGQETEPGNIRSGGL